MIREHWAVGKEFAIIGIAELVVVLVSNFALPIFLIFFRFSGKVETSADFTSVLTKNLYLKMSTHFFHMLFFSIL